MLKDIHTNCVETARRFASLTSLDVSLCRVTDGDLAALTALQGLQAISMQSCEGLSDAGLAHLQGLPGLMLLDLQNCCKARIPFLRT